MTDYTADFPDHMKMPLCILSVNNKMSRLTRTYPTNDKIMTPTSDNTLTPTSDNILTPISDNTLTPTSDNILTLTSDNTYQ